MLCSGNIIAFQYNYAPQDMLWFGIIRFTNKLIRHYKGKYVANITNKINAIKPKVLEWADRSNSSI